MTDRLDRVEAILEAVATSHRTALSRLDRLEGSHEASSQRLDRIEQIAASNATTIQSAGERLKEIEAITLSNARAIEANSNAIAELWQRDEVVLAEMRQNIADVVGMITTMGESFQQYADRAEQERAALSASLQSLINALTQRFSGNGHTE